MPWPFLAKRSLGGGISRPGRALCCPAGQAGTRLDGHGVDAQAGTQEGAQARLGAGAGLGQALGLDAAEVQGEGHVHALRQAALDAGGIGGDAKHAGGVRGAEVAGLLVVLLHACRRSTPQRTAHERTMEQQAVMVTPQDHVWVLMQQQAVSVALLHALAETARKDHNPTTAAFYTFTLAQVQQSAAGMLLR